jgi:DNA-binding GntR family transcriptional regulator
LGSLEFLNQLPILRFKASGKEAQNFCGNRFQKETYKRYNLIRFLLIKFAIRTAEDRSCSIKQHRDMVNTYSTSQFDLASELLEQHYIHGLALIKEYNP